MVTAVLVNRSKAGRYKARKNYPLVTLEIIRSYFACRDYNVQGYVIVRARNRSKVGYFVLGVWAKGGKADMIVDGGWLDFPAVGGHELFLPLHKIRALIGR
jgi:hypothetical protein